MQKKLYLYEKNYKIFMKSYYIVNYSNIKLYKFYQKHSNLIK